MSAHRRSQKARRAGRKKYNKRGASGRSQPMVNHAPSAKKRAITMEELLKQIKPVPAPASKPNLVERVRNWARNRRQPWTRQKGS